MSDGRLWFNTKIDNSQVDKDLRQLKQKIQKSQEDISNSQNAKLPLLKQSEQLGVALDKAKAKLEELKQKQSEAAQALTGQDPAAYIEAYANKPQIDADVAAQTQEVAKLQSEWDSVNRKIDSYNQKIERANIDIEHNTAKISQLDAQTNSSGAQMQAAFDKAHLSAQKFGKQLLSIAKRTLVFSAIYSVLRGVANYMGKVLKTNDEYAAQLAKLKGALLTAFQPIYEYVLPGVLAVLQVLTAIVQVVANVLSVLFGKTASQSAKNAKALNEEADAISGVGGAAEDAKKQLAGFDEINQLGSMETGGGGGASGITADFSDFDTAEYKAKIDELTVYLSGALLALGAILAFSGANVPLGIALMAAGAIGMVSVVKENWGAMSNELNSAITAVMLILGVAALAIGAILAFSGARIGLGIALMAVGAASLAGAVALNWNSIVTALQGPVGELVGYISGALLVIGAVLAFSGANVPLGIALMAAGAVGLVTVAALNWDAILERLKTTWASIKQWFNTHVKPKLTLEYWKGIFSNIADALAQKIKDGINTAIALCNQFISWLNSRMTLSWNSFSVGGVQVVQAGSFKLLNIPSIPALAQGAVLPANKPFLAMVGDQKNGTNVEAPLETIKQALAEVLTMNGGTGDITIRFEGDLAQLARILKPAIDKENKRVGGSLAGGNV